MIYLFECSYCGFNNATSFETIDENDIREVEKFVREELDKFIKTNADSTNANKNEHDEQYMIKHFGQFYAQCPEQFRFLPGDRKIIQKIRDHIHDVINKKGRKKAFQHFNDKSNRFKAMQHSNEVSDQITCSSTFANDEMKTKLYNLVSSKLIEFDVPLSTRSVFDESFITIANENNKTTGEVICVVCHVQSKNPENIKPKQVYCRGKSWVISNFNKHFARAHQKQPSCKIHDNSQSDNENHMSEMEDGNVEYLNEEYFIEEEINPLTNEMNYSTESLQSFIAHGTNEIEKELNAQINAQLIAMWNTVTLNREPQDQQVRCRCDNGLIVSFDVAKILMDGDCMLGSLIHQIFRYDLHSNQHKLATQKLRMDIVNYINQYYEDFKQHLRGHILDLEESGLDESCGIREINDIDAKCKHLLNNCMINSGFWASGESLKATACLLDVNIIVFYEAGPIYYVHKTGQLSKRTVIIAFRLQDNETQLRNHYDSVCYISADEIYKTAKHISELLNKDPQITVDLVTSP